MHWKSSRHFLDRAIHPKGEIKQRRPRFFRNSYHRAPGFAAFKGPARLEPGWYEEGSILDIAPTLMGLLGEPPFGFHARPLPSLFLITAVYADSAGQRLRWFERRSGGSDVWVAGRA